jgi:hypothetical protein
MKVRGVGFFVRASAAAFTLLGAASIAAGANESAAEVILQARSVGEAESIVQEAGGSVTSRLAIIDAVSAKLTADQIRWIETAHPTARVYSDSSVGLTFSSDPRRHSGEDRWDDRCLERKPEASSPTLIRADRLHDEGMTGAGVTIAVVDTGLSPLGGLTRNADGDRRVLAQYDAIEDRENPDAPKRLWNNDANGHGTHVASVMTSTRASCGGQIHGIAPGADLVSIRSLDENGAGRYIDVIRGIGWVVEHQSQFGIRVMSLAFSAVPHSHYWDDPVNQAAMRAWQAGIVVVTSAGNRGPAPMTIGVPGNTPYVITVGAISDNGTPGTRSDDFVTRFSSAGPTVEGFVKPEVVAPGARVLGLMSPQSLLATTYPEFRVRGQYYSLSGTSQAAAVVAGAAALLLQDEPWLTPDAVKSRLMGTADPAFTGTSELAFSLFQQGAGRVDAHEAVHREVPAMANLGLDVDKDLLGIEHYGGRANLDENGNYYIMGMGEELLWNGAYLWRDSYLWRDAYLWANGLVWSEAYFWRDAYLWRNAFLFSDAFLWRSLFGKSIFIQIERE